MSGGVDSSVAALLLHRAGHEVIGVFMNNWEETGEDGSCTAERDWADVRAVCDAIGIPYYAVNFAKEYRERVFAHFLAEYRAGRTPNPDVLCNREIKFKAFLDLALQLGAERVATGHFARSENVDGAYRLLRGADPAKDQSYFLYMLGQRALALAEFPVGGLAKAQVRALAREAGLPTSAKRDSTGICFIGERDFKAFLRTYLPAQPGETRDVRTGKAVGRHEGLMYHTLGQRRGLGIGGGGDGRRWFVVSKDLENNLLWVAQGDDHPALYTAEAQVGELTWIAERPPLAAGEAFRCTAKYRYRQGDQQVTARLAGGGLHVTAEEPQRAVTPGQSLVLYQGEVCLGGGVVERAW
ncbi:MAG: tRNA 2-thiouridine(34) synthase MnmA [Clostridia bacterium]|nr:tRNA 2-thiouridine(34) synthase MnmA [Clostridia bacterium]